MKIQSYLAILVAAFVLSACSSVKKGEEGEHTFVRTVNSEEDPYLWLEDVEGEKPIQFVKEWSEKTKAELKSTPRAKTIEQEARRIIMAQDRVAVPSLRGRYVYNFWQDSKHVQGIWRRTTITSYKKARPKWDILLDVDKLSKAEGVKWVYKGTTCLYPKYERCLVSLSNGGKDAVTIREFYIPSKSFVKTGFTLPEGKSRVGWINENTVFVAPGFAPYALTDSGYPATVWQWKRGQSLDKAEKVFEGKKTDVSVGAYYDQVTGFAYVYQGLDFFNSNYFLLDEKLRKTKLNVPTKSEIYGYIDGQIVLKLNEDTRFGRMQIKAGSFVSIPADQNMKAVSVIATPTKTRFPTGAVVLKDSMYITSLDNVVGRLDRVILDDQGKWQTNEIRIPDFGTVSIYSADETTGNVVFSYENFTQPETYYLFQDWQGVVSKPEVLKRAPKRFNSANLEAGQYFATSKDGTKVPYFVIHKKDLKLDGKNPTVLYGYGGFEISLTPEYLEATGKIWVEKGGVYVIANIRGGGEYGPDWHDAALKQNRQRAYDDFIAVAEDLVQRKITSPNHLGIYGGSNGGLLVGAVMAQRPDLFGAVVCAVPLLDMLRFHKLLAGASWMGEYGNPDDPKDRAAIIKYSPYQNVRSGVSYPSMLIMTSTKDDRVHPGHARKMAAKLKDLNQPVIYYENTDGGHGGASNLEERVLQRTLMWSYFFRQLFN